MAGEITAETLRRWLYDGGELALLDIRERGQIAMGHILFSAPLPYSRFEIDLPDLVPNTTLRMVLCDDGDGIAARAAARARAMGYARVHVLAGGVAAWADAGHTLYQGVNVPSKAFGELVEHACATPHLSPDALARMQTETPGEFIIVDGRTPAEFARMNIPGGQSCPNGELALRIDGLAPDPATTIVVNCAGRTRSIIGAQTLIDLGLPNRVVALENGTQGWTLSGHELGHGARPTMPPPATDLAARRQRAEALARRHGVARIDAATLGAWLHEGDRTTYLLDIRTAKEREADTAAQREARERLRIVQAPGGQLIQATDQWIGVRRARLVVLDDEGVRAPVVASWLARQGHEAAVVEGGLAALAELNATRLAIRADLPDLPRLDAAGLAALLREGAVTVLDLRPSTDWHEGHLVGAHWTIRPRIAAGFGADPGNGPHVVIASDPETAALAAIDLAEAGITDIRLVDGGMADWQAAGLAVETSPDASSETVAIDFIAFTHGRHDGDAEASRRYLAWEIGLVAQLDAKERAVFRI